MYKKKLFSPFERFINIESFSGILLLLATLVALVWVNSPFAKSYHAISDYSIGFSYGGREFSKSVLFWVNDGLMAIFFFVIGLEVKREFLLGELNSVKKFAFPMVGALGGMFIPVFLYLLLNSNTETLSGFGIPMATDIAFSLSVLKVLGNRIPLSLKVFLTAFAIIDDIGAILVIAIFYSSSISLLYLAIAFALLGLLFLLSAKGLYSKFTLIFFGSIIWFLLLKSGIHPTLAGVLVAFTVPIRQRVMTSEFTENLEGIIHKIKQASLTPAPILTKEQIKQVNDLQVWKNRYQSPLQYLEHKLHNWVAYIIIPIFALANAGVPLFTDVPMDYTLSFNIAVALIVGKSIGITGIVWLSKKLRIIEIPKDISQQQIVGVAFLAGIGFTMSIFIASLTFSEQATYMSSAKIGILLGSFLAAVVGYLVLRLAPKKK